MQENITDEELIRRFVNGDESAFNTLANRYIEKIYWHARRMTGNHLDADEILQEVLIVLYKKLKTFEFKSSLYTWIYTITNTRSINLINKRRIKNLFSLEEVPNNILDDRNLSAELESKQKLQQIEKALQKLPVKQREVFIMRNYNELSYEEISEITGKSIGALKANHFHAINKLKEMLKDG
jgi:RNA polymerase sigma-70 factor (ECF subfamily)